MRGADVFGALERGEFSSATSAMSRWAPLAGDRSAHIHLRPVACIGWGELFGLTLLQPLPGNTGRSANSVWGA